MANMSDTSAPDTATAALGLDFKVTMGDECYIQISTNLLSN